MMRRLLILLLFALLASPALASQLNHGQVEGGHMVEFNYVFRDYQAREQSLSLDIDKAALAESPIRMGRHDNKAANRYAINAIEDYLAGLNDPRLTYSIKPQSSGYHVEMKGRNMAQAELNQIKLHIDRLQKQSWQAYLKDFFLTEHPKGDAVMLDYGRLSAYWQPSMQTAARQIRQKLRGADDRYTIDFTLNFLQSIPYDPLGERQGDTGFLPPPAMLAANRGECESKSVAAAALLKNMYPHLDLIAVIIPDHVLIGLNIPASRHDSVIDYQGRTYVLAEPTGERILPAGEVFDKSHAALNSGNYFVREM